MILRLCAVLTLLAAACETAQTGAIVVDDWSALPTPCDGDYCEGRCEVECSAMRQKHREICAAAGSICHDRPGADPDQCNEDRTACMDESTPLFEDCRAGCMDGFAPEWGR